MVDFRSGEAVEQHPAVRYFLYQGWEIQRAKPRIVESDVTKLLVVLELPGELPLNPS